MKKNLLFLILSFLAFELSAQTTGSTSQQGENGNWQSMGLNIHDGTNSFSGVEGYCQLTTCNGIETVLLKLVNLNPYSVKAGWKDLILTKDDQRLPGNNAQAQDSVTIAANSQLVGNCTGNTTPLRIKLSDFGTDGANFKNIIAADFDFIIIHSNQH